jgi:hypothetical protein
MTQSHTESTDKDAMEIFRFNILPMADIERREAFKEAVNNCPHCGAALEFQVEIYERENRLKEDGHCPSCSVHVRTEVHDIQ